MSQYSYEGGEAKNAELDVLLGKSALAPAFKAKVRMLVLLSERNGFVTVQNINECISDSETDPESIEEIMNILDNLDIKLLDEDEVEIYRKKVEKAESSSANKPRSYDALDRYKSFFIKLGYKPLLKSGEVNDLARRIEESEQHARDSLFRYWLSLPFQLELSFKVLRKDESYDGVVISGKVESCDAYYKMLPKALEECAKLEARLDKAWQKYLEETDPDKKSRMREAYRNMELMPQEGCKYILRKLCIKTKLLQGWLEGAEIKSDIEDAIQITTAFSASAVLPSPGPAGWQALYVNRARDIERRWRLSPPELAQLARNFRRHMVEADKAREEMVMHNSRLVSLIAESYQDRGVTLAELIHAGNASLRVSIDDFNPRRGCPFTHYAAMGVRHALLCLIARKAGIEEVPVRMLEFLEIIPEVHEDLKQELGRGPTIEELANEMNIAVDVVPKLLRVPGLDGLSLN